MHVAELLLTLEHFVLLWSASHQAQQAMLECLDLQGSLQLPCRSTFIVVSFCASNRPSILLSMMLAPFNSPQVLQRGGHCSLSHLQRHRGASPHVSCKNSRGSCHLHKQIVHLAALECSQMLCICDHVQASLSRMCPSLVTAVLWHGAAFMSLQQCFVKEHV